MEENQNNYNENEQNNIEPVIRSSRPTRKERVKKKTMEIMKIIGSVVGHQFKITILISAIFLVVIILLCSAALYILELNDIEVILKLLAM